MDRCTKAVVGLFGCLFLMALIFVPCTTTTTTLRLDPYSRVYLRTTIPKNSYVLLPQYILRRSSTQDRENIHARSFQWAAFMVLIAVLGTFDYLVICRYFRRAGRRADPAGPENPAAAGKDETRPPGFSLLR
ncbi:MAG: hypothetical protein ABSG19_01055 [Candidatus Aminicenantales bacterium]